MYIHIKNNFLFSLLIFLIAQTYGQQVRFSRPMIAVKKHQPAYMIMVNDKKLPAPIINDITRIDVHERLNGVGSFTIKLNNQDGKQKSFKYRKSDPFNSGDKIEIFLLKDSNETPRRLIQGTIASVNEYNNKPDSSFHAIEGTVQKPDITFKDENKSIAYKIDSSNRQLFTIAKRMVKDQIEVSLADGNGVTGIPVLRVGRRIILDGIGATFNGVYYISVVTHTFSPSGYSTRFELSRNDTD